MVVLSPCDRLTKGLILSETIFAPEGGWRVRILDLSGGAEDNIVEEVGGFPDLIQANAFARAYVRDSIERCRMPGLSAADILKAWFSFGEDAEVLEAGDQAGVRPMNSMISQPMPQPRWNATGARLIPAVAVMRMTRRESALKSVKV